MNRFQIWPGSVACFFLKIVLPVPIINDANKCLKKKKKILNKIIYPMYAKKKKVFLIFLSIKGITKI